LWRATNRGAICSEPGARGALGRLVLHLEQAAPRVIDLDEFLGALVQLAELHGGWLRDLEEWTVVSPSADDQLSELLRHLLARYPVPMTMDSLFKQELPGTRAEWFLHLGRGGNLRTAPGLTARLTSRMAHFALLAPEWISAAAAIRYGQVLGLEGTPELAGVLAGSSWGRYLGSDSHEEWVLEVFQWMVNHPELPQDQVHPVLDFAAECKRRDPDFSMKGRGVRALLGLMEDWHRELRRQAAVQAQVTRTTSDRYRPSGYRPGKWHDGEGRQRSTWSMQEIRDRNQLFREGAEMMHCVASYDSRIRSGQSVIWALVLESSTGFRGSALTVEVHPNSRRIVQARGRRNRQPKPEERRFLELWARENGLSIAI
jgi:hypothetical protein